MEKGAAETARAPGRLEAMSAERGAGGQSPQPEVEVALPRPETEKKLRKRKPSGSPSNQLDRLLLQVEELVPRRMGAAQRSTEMAGAGARRGTSGSANGRRCSSSLHSLRQIDRSGGRPRRGCATRTAEAPGVPGVERGVSPGGSRTRIDRPLPSGGARPALHWAQWWTLFCGKRSCSCCVPSLHSRKPSPGSCATSAGNRARRRR